MFYRVMEHFKRSKRTLSDEKIWFNIYSQYLPVYNDTPRLRVYVELYQESNFVSR